MLAMRGKRVALALLGLALSVGVLGQDDTLDDNDRYAWMRAVGKRGAIVSSSDAGLTWDLKVLEGQPDLHDVSFLDARNGYAVGAQSSVYFSVNAGLQWSKAEVSSVGASETMEGVFMSGNPGPVYIVGQNGLYMSTEDGEEWSAWRVSCPVDATDGTLCPKTDYAANISGTTYTALYSVRYKDSINGIVVGDEALVLVTSDSGETFVKMEPLQLPLPSSVTKRPALRSIAMDFLGNMTVAGDNGLLFVVTPQTRFSDDTVTFGWKACRPEGPCAETVPVSLSGVSVSTQAFKSAAMIGNHIMAAGEGTILAINFQQAWKQLGSIGDAGDNITGIYFPTPNTGVLVTEGGKIYRKSSTVNDGEYQKIELLNAPFDLSFTALAGRNADDVTGAASQLQMQTIISGVFAGLVFSITSTRR